MVGASAECHDWTLERPERLIVADYPELKSLTALWLFSGLCLHGEAT